MATVLFMYENQYFIDKDVEIMVIYENDKHYQLTLGGKSNDK
ncbi:hypothetical protein [Clostridium uliginosum]|nr:hypothetical protein [Clostridium uliginosum]